MARSRNLKPGFFTNGDLLECQPLARLLFAGLWTEADCRGILEDRPKTLKIKILPGDNCDIEGLLSELETHGFIIRYLVAETRCILVTNFGKHQNPHVNEKPNSLPAPEQYGASTVLVPEQNQSTPADSLLLIPDSLIPSPSADALEEPRRSKAKGKATAVPETYTPSDTQYAWALTELGFEDRRVLRETEKFLDFHRSRGTTMKDWDAGWRNWMRRAVEFAPRGKGGAATTPVDGKSYWDGTQYRRADGLVV